MDEKTFEYLEKILTEVQGVKQEIHNVKNQVTKIENQVTKIEVDHGNKLDALLDGYKQTYEKLEEHDKRFNEIEQKIESQDVEIKVLKRVK
jgi:peptidoglycan hydrolase CwlO-like protein